MSKSSVCLLADEDKGFIILTYEPQKGITFQGTRVAQVILPSQNENSGTPTPMTAEEVVLLGRIHKDFLGYLSRRSVVSTIIAKGLRGRPNFVARCESNQKRYLYSLRTKLNVLLSKIIERNKALEQQEWTIVAGYNVSIKD